MSRNGQVVALVEEETDKNEIRLKAVSYTKGRTVCEIKDFGLVAREYF